jgi:hypothetical protein
MPESTNNSQITDEVRRRAAEYAELAHQKYGTDANFDTVDRELAENWAKQSGNASTPWASVRGIVQDAWSRRAELKADSAANKAAFDQPPTFSDSGNAVPRNYDEPNR